MRAPNATATAASGCVRRHSSGNTSATASTSATGRQTTSSRKMPSRTAVGTSTATSTQSRHTRAGGCGARGSAQSERTALLTMTRSVENPTGRRIGRKDGPCGADRPIGQRKSGLIGRCGRRRGSSRLGHGSSPLQDTDRPPKEDHHDVARAVPAGPVRRPPPLGRDRVMAGRLGAGGRSVRRLRSGARGLLRGAGPRLPGGRRPAHGRPVGPGRTHRAGGPDAARRAGHLLRLGRRAGRPGRGPGGGRRPAQGARHHRPGGGAGRRTRGGGGERRGLARRSGRPHPRPVPGARGAEQGRPGEPQGSSAPGPERARRCGSRWAATCSSRSRRPRRASAS